VRFADEENVRDKEDNLQYLRKNCFDKETLNVLTASFIWETFFPESNPTRL